MTHATNNRNAQAFWEAVYLAKTTMNLMPRSIPYQYACAALDDWLRAFGTPEERVQFEEWRAAQDAGNEAEAGA